MIDPARSMPITMARRPDGLEVFCFTEINKDLSHLREFWTFPRLISKQDESGSIVGLRIDLASRWPA